MAAGKEIFSDKKSVSERELTKMRRSLFGYIFQNFYLIPTLTVYENIAVPQSFYKKEKVDYNIDTLLKNLGVSKRRNHLPGQLSGGEMQRVAIARALVNKPEIILADEPTGNLDSKNGIEVINLLSELNKEGTTIVMVTHSDRDAAYAHRIINLFDGQVV